MAQRVYAIYRTSNGRLKRWVVTDTACREHVAPDETLIEMPLADYLKSGGADGIQAWITAETGKDPADADRYALVDDETGDVVRVIFDEPDNPKFKSPAGCSLVKHAEAGPGWKREGGEMKKPQSVDATSPVSAGADS